MKEVNKLAPEILKQFGFDEKGITDCIKMLSLKTKLEAMLFQN